MLFNSWTFGGFMLLFYPLFLICRRHLLARNILLVVFSYLFYGWWDSRFLILVAISTSVDYMAALGAAGKPVSWRDRGKAAAWLLIVTAGSVLFARQSDPWIPPLVIAGTVVVMGVTALFDRLQPKARSVAWLLLSLVTNLGILLFFKYSNFFYASLHDALGTAGVHIPRIGLEIVLPVGLSFYTFQAIGRTVDSFKGRFDPQYSLINYAAYHAFFPQLVAGPIERAPHLMPQFEKVLPLDWRMVVSGLRVFLWGLYMKVVIADNIAPLANQAFDAHGHVTAATAVLGMVAFTFQIYCDFAGYSNMARGIARTLGFSLIRNFNLPYFARTPAEFWQRWHISLSQWLRDYLYIPLGGNRKGEGRTYVNLMITMLLGGLWHGAAWTFVIWGAIHGGIQVIYRALKIEDMIDRAQLKRHAWAVNLLAWAILTPLVIWAWAFFRARAIGDAGLIIARSFGTTGYSWDLFQPLVFYVAPLLVVEMWQRQTQTDEVLNAGPFFMRYTTTLATLLAVITLATSQEQPFIYFNF